MSQNPTLPEENIETVKAPARKGRKPRAAAPSAEANAESIEAPADENGEKKPARRTRKAKVEETEAPKRRGRPRKVKDEENAEVPAVAPAEAPAEAVASEIPAETPAEAPKTRRGRTRKTKAEGTGEAVDAPAAETVPSQEPESTQEVSKPVRRSRRNEPEAAEAPVRKERSRRPARKKESEALGAPDYDSDLDDGPVVHLGSAVVLDDMLPPAAVRESTEAEETEKESRNPRRGRQDRKGGRAHRAEPGNQAAPKEAPAVADDLGNRAEAPAPESGDAQPAWFDDGVVTNILPYPGEFYGDIRNERRINNKKGRRGKDQVPSLPADFDFSAAMLNDSVLGTVLAPSEEELFHEEDGPQPVLSDQPVAQPLSADDMDEKDFEALDAAVNGNRIDAPGRSQQKESRQDRKGRKGKEERAAREEKKSEEKKADKKPEKKAKAEAAEALKAKRMLYISVVPDEQAEVVITEDGLVTEYFVEMAHQVKIRGNIYKGVINNIDTNLQAAFVNFGNGKNGFLQIDEVHPEYYLVPHDPSSGPKYPPIQKVLKVGQEVLVQVVKEPAGTKGAFLTTWISIAGRFLVLTPGQEQIGVSRKVEDPEERARLKELLNDIQPGENMGVIIRTASEGVNKASIQQDLQLLQKLWKDIQKKAPVEKTPSLIYQEADLATRSVRDYLSDDIEEIWVDDEGTKSRVEEIVGVIFPERVHDMVKMHKDSRQTLWERFNLSKQLETVTSREVVLPSGGRLVFDQTEALMAIDINSGKTQGKTNFEAMVFRTNMEAAEAIARHLRLRDIGGQVVIDFIEMRDKSHCREVERTLRNAMHKDRARHDVGHMSSFGLLELVRQRTGTSAISITTEPCPHCHGTGMRRNMEWQALQAMRDLQTKLCKSLDSGKNKKNEQKGDKTEPVTFVYESDVELALYILNRKRDRIAALEEKYGVRIEVRLKS